MFSNVKCCWLSLAIVRALLQLGVPTTKLPVLSCGAPGGSNFATRIWSNFIFCDRIIHCLKSFPRFTDICQNLLRFSISITLSILPVQTPLCSVRSLQTTIYTPWGRMKARRPPCVYHRCLLSDPDFWNLIRVRSLTRHRAIECYSSRWIVFSIPTNGNALHRSGARSLELIPCKRSLMVPPYQSRPNRVTLVVSLYVDACLFDLI